MPVRITLGRFAALAVSCAVLVSGGLVLASTLKTRDTETAGSPGGISIPTKTVPDVVGQPYVFAESILQQRGFAWRVVGKVAGWPEAVVENQDPPGGVEVLDTGAPLVKLELAKPPTPQHGTPENSSPYPADEVIYPSGSTRTSASSITTRTTVETQTGASMTGRTSPKPAATITLRTTTVKARPPAFYVPGAKKEPLDEIPLPERARRLKRWLEQHPQRTDADVRYWLYQHAWIVTGAKFGWWHGAEALRILIAVDERAQELWGIGAKSEAEAREALAFVRAHGG